MATTIDRLDNGNWAQWIYAALGNESGISFEGWHYADKTVIAFGTGTVTIEGSPDGTNWVGLKDQSGTTISMVLSASTASALILENPRFMRAKNTSGTGALIVITGCK